ncbi:MAG: right-handed parallel beta-helix repeat-containing protein [Calditrichota bacterium]
MNVQPGTVFRFLGLYDLTVHGMLSAIGTEADSIHFTVFPEDEETGWRGLRFVSSHQSCQLRYCIVEHVRGTEYAHPDGSGGVYCNAASPRLERCTIRGNVASFHGGGLACYNGSHPQLLRCTISGNSVAGDLIHYGGGAYIKDSSPTFTSCDLSFNTGISRGGGLYADNSELIMDSCVIHDNYCPAAGGGIYFINGAPLLTSCDLFSNLAPQGGALFLHSFADIEYCTFHENTATDGGAIFSNWYGANLRRCVIYQNFVAGRGSALFCQTSSPILENCTIALNISGTGGEVNISNGSPEINSCFIGYSDGPAVHFANGAESHLHHSNFFGNVGGNFAFQDGNPAHAPANLGRLVRTNNNTDSCDVYYNILLDPEFVNAAQNDFHLQESSSCIHAGDPNLPHDPDGTITDIGAFGVTLPYQLPGPFDLLLPTNGDTISNYYEFCWQTAHDPDQSDVITYELFFATEDTIFRYMLGTDTCVGIAMDTLPIADSVAVAWFVKAHCLFPDTVRRSTSTFFFFHIPVTYPPSPFDLVLPNDGDTLMDEQEFCWQAALDPDSHDVVTYRIYFVVGTDSVSYNCGQDTCFQINLNGLPLGDSLLVRWFVGARSLIPPITIQSQSVRNFFLIHSINLPSPFDLISPADDDTLMGVQEFCWQTSFDLDDEDVVTYSLHFMAGEDSASYNVGEDTCFHVNLNDLPFGDSLLVRWFVRAHSSIPEATTPSTTSRNFYRLLLDADLRDQALPARFVLYPNYPNPFNPTTNITFSIPRTELVVLKIYDLLGREVAVLRNERLLPGTYSVVFDGRELGNGMYFCRLSSSDHVATQKMLLLK